jgi:hypothetical protein
MKLAVMLPAMNVAIPKVARLRVESPAVRFGDSTRLRWISGFPMPAGGTEYGPDRFDLYGQAAVIRDCLHEQITLGAHRPVVMKGHNDEGTVYGTVRDWRMLTRDQAAAFGVRQSAELEVYFGLDITCADTAAAYDDGRVVYSSPEMRGRILAGDVYAYQDETGYDWPFFIGEVSIVGKPHNKRQVPADTLRGVQMMEDGSMDSMQVLIDEVRAMRAELAGLKQAGKVATAEDMISEVVEDVVEEAVEEVAEPDEVAAASMESAPVDPEKVEMSERIARLERDIKLRDAKALVSAAMNERTFTASRDKLVEVAMRDPAVFAMMRDNAPKRPAASARIAGVSDTSPVRIGSPEHRAKIAAMKEAKVAAKGGKPLTAYETQVIMREARAFATGGAV